MGEVARALEVNPNVLHRWRREIREGPGNVFPGHGKQRWAEGRIAELERKIGQQALEIDFLTRSLQRIEEQRMLQALTGNPPSTKGPGHSGRSESTGSGLTVGTTAAKLGRRSPGPASTVSMLPAGAGPDPGYGFTRRDPEDRAGVVCSYGRSAHDARVALIAAGR